MRTKKTYKPLGNKEFVDLQNKWYDKLKQKGFDDIEWLDRATGIGQNSDYLKNAVNGNKNVADNLAKQQYYRLLQNYHMHQKELKGKDKFILKHMAAGKTYRDIVKLYAKKYGKRVKAGSLYSIFMVGKKIEKKCYEWNKVDKEGLASLGNDFYVTEILLSDAQQVYYETILEQEQILLGDLRKWSM